MAISQEQVAHVARLARLGLSQEEKEAFAGQLSRILEHIAVLNRLDTTDVPPLAHVLPLQNVVRRDAVGRSLGQDKVLANAPDADAGCFKVPKITEGESS